MKEKVLIIFLLLFSFGIRVWDLDKNPPGFFVDEAWGGYEAYNILHTGRDQYGDFLPLFFKGYFSNGTSDGISPYHVYLTAPFVAVFGLNEFSVRLSAVFFGVLTILVFYLVLREYLSKEFSFLGTILLSISPWHFHMSRILLADFYSWTLFSLTAYWFFIKGWKQEKVKFFVFSSIFFGLANYGYFASRLATPLLTFSTLLILFVGRKFKWFVVMLACYLITISPFVYYHITNPELFKRINTTTNIASSGGIKLNMDFVKKYTDHFSDDFLFILGDSSNIGQVMKRHSIPNIGLLYPYQKVFIILGVVYLAFLIIKKKRTELLIVFFMVLIFPVPDTLTNTLVPLATRSFLGVIPLHFLVIFGIYAGWLILGKLFKKTIIVKSILVCFMLFITLRSCLSLASAFEKQKYFDSGYYNWQWGIGEIVRYFTKVENDFDDLYVSGFFDAPNIYFKFFSLNDCLKCKYGGVSEFDPNIRQLFAVSPGETAGINIRRVHKILYSYDGSEGFYIVEIESLK